MLHNINSNKMTLQLRKLMIAGKSGSMQIDDYDESLNDVLFLFYFYFFQVIIFIIIIIVVDDDGEDDDDDDDDDGA